MSIQRNKTGDETQQPPASPLKAGQSSFALPRPSGGLREVLLRASMIGEHMGDGFDLSFTSILLGFLASQTPLSRWFQAYVADVGVDVDAMLARIHAGRRLLEDVAGRSVKSLSVTDTRPTVSAENIIRGAVSLRDQFIGEQPSNELHQRHVMAAYIYRCPPEHEKQLASWSFVRAHWSGAFLAFISSMPELRVRELKRWVEIHHKTFGAAPEIHEPLESPSQPTAPAVPSDVTSLHLDSPADVDYLGRKGFAEALGVRLNRVWRESSALAGGGGESRGSFVLHMHGPWGSGKTSLLNFLKRELQPPRGQRVDADGPGTWVVVEFNAWQHQRINPPWWPLLDAVYSGAVRQLADGKIFAERGRARRVRLRERWWRLSTGRKDHLAAMAVATIALAGFIFWFWHGAGAVDLPTVGKSVATALGTVGVIWSTFLVAGRTLLSGSARSAQTFVETAGDPMERVCAHFRELVGWVGKPVAIFIDDLDRCQPRYVVDLLEGVQTLFSDPRVVYVVAADRRWLNNCFETSYEGFAKAVREPGRRLGSLFLEKAFELSVSVPRLSPQMREVYWDYLVGGARPDIGQFIEAEGERARAELVGAEDEEEVLSRLREPTGDPLRDQVWKGAAVSRLASRKVAETTEYFLKPFSPLLEPNPRAMKRLVNAYSVLRDMALLAGVDVLGDMGQRRQLALWAIVSLRWPLLEEHLENHPEDIDSIREGRTSVGDLPLVADEDLQKLVESGEVHSVFTGGQTGTGLTSEVVRELIGIGAARPTAASVA